MGRACFADNLYRFAVMHEAEESCSLALAQESFRLSDYSIPELIVGIVLSPDFRFREAHETADDAN